MGGDRQAQPQADTEARLGQASRCRPEGMVEYSGGRATAMSSAGGGGGGTAADPCLEPHLQMGLPQKRKPLNVLEETVQEHFL